MAQRQSCQFPMQVGVGGLKQIGFAEKRKKIKLCAARRYLWICQIGLNLKATMRGSWNQSNEVQHPDLKFCGACSAK